VRALGGRTAIITGAGQGLGRAYAETFASEGVTGLVVNDVSAEHLQETADALRSYGVEVVTVVGDCADLEVGRRLVAAAIERFDRLDILVNNAGCIRDRMIFNMSEDDWDHVIRVNLKGAFTATRFACAHWRDEAAAQRPTYGRIINTSSAAGLFGNIGQPNYAAAKAGIIGLTYDLALSMQRYGVTANAIAPGADTNPSAAITGVPEALRRAMRPEHIAPFVVYLASPHAAHVTGQVFHIAGGRIDRVAHHVLEHGALKREGAWSVDEIAAIFDEHVNGAPPPTMQSVLREIAADLMVGA
jgi:NAD(P)-dependent dehydrogenase (short-subunit alcohol dehydrogenase family)